MTRARALAAPVVVGMMFWPAERARRGSLWATSRTFWSLVYEWIVFIRPRLMPQLSWTTLAAGARQFVVQLALLMMWCLAESYLSSLTPRTMVMSSFLAGALMRTFLAPAVDVAGGRGGVREPTGGLDDDVDAQVAPGQLGGLLLGEDLDLLAVDDDRGVGVLDRALEGAVGRVVLEEQRVHLGRHEVVDGHDLDVRGPLDDGLERLAADAAEAVDADAGRHGWSPCLGALPDLLRTAALDCVGPVDRHRPWRRRVPGAMCWRPLSRRPQPDGRRGRPDEAGPMRREAPCR